MTQTDVIKAVRQRENNPLLAIRIRGDEVHVFRQPKNCQHYCPQWDYYCTLKELRKA